MSTSENVEVRESQIPGAGRGLFARKDFQPGDLVVALDRPLVAELDVERLLDTCAWCFQRSATDQRERAQAVAMGFPTGFTEVKACTGCRRVSYCSKSCQSKAWKREHKYECKALAPTNAPNLPVGVRAAVKLLGRLKADGEGKNASLQEILKFKPFAGEGGFEEFAKKDKKRFDDYNGLSWAAWKYAGEPKFDGGDGKAIARAFVFNILSNTFGLGCPFDDIELGIGFDNLISAANHSCDPNVVNAFNQPSIILRAIKPIKKGEEVFMRYVDNRNPISVRQQELQDGYHFSCQCSKCNKGPVSADDTLRTVEELPAEYRKLADKLKTQHEKELSKFTVPASDSVLQSRLSAMQAEAFSISGTITNLKQSSIEQMRDTVKMCIESRAWSWARQPVPLLCRRLFGTYMESGEPYRAFRIGIKMYFEITPEVHPQKFYPERLIDTWALMTVANVLCGPVFKEIHDELFQSGVDLRMLYLGCLLDVHDNIPSMFGRESPFGRVVEKTYKQIMDGIGLHESELRDRIKMAWPALETLARSVNALNL
ncbi:hypothetical protein BX600DRAFT_507765 [Xylariales sp. PMI_506]|nr:hypothetical protein BX600DRAFT_507765 [Xylariales sp. PMI_506]